MTEQVDTFLAITGSSDGKVAENFIEMAGGNLETAISLFFEHGTSYGASSSSNNNNYDNDSYSTTQSPPVQNFESDAALAERLQKESYEQQQQQQNDLRAPDEAVHERLVGDVFPGTFGGIGGAYGELINSARRRGNDNDIVFGGGRRGVFNQVDSDEDVSDSDEDRVVELDSDGEPIEESTRGLSSTQRRLAKIFRPPFDIIEKLDLDSAKRKARSLKKWLLVNIQDTSDFQCQILNRDFWSSSTVKEVVRQNFIFLQYHKDSRSGEQYSQFYSYDELPHIAILDPLTGERLKIWSKVPQVSSWVEEVYEFLNQFTLDPSSAIPVVQHTKKIDPTTLSEEDQLKYVINQSLGQTDDKDKDDVQILNSGDSNDPIEIDDDNDESSKPQTDEDIIKNINAVNHPDAEGDNATVTRVQIRTGDGKRLVHKFKLDDKVLTIYQFVKANFEQVSNNEFFTLTSQRENLINKLNDNINDSGLKNASILLEVTANDE